MRVENGHNKISSEFLDRFFDIYLAWSFYVSDDFDTYNSNYKFSEVLLMRESVFTLELKKSLERIGYWTYKIADMPTSRLTDRLSFTPEKPCDLIVAAPKAKGYYIETKQIRKWEAFGYRSLRPSQKRNGELLSLLGHKYLIALNVRVPGETSKLLFMDYQALKFVETIPAVDLKKIPMIPGRGGIFKLKNKCLDETYYFDEYVKSRAAGILKKDLKLQRNLTWK